jgi:hypothetical protein
MHPHELAALDIEAGFAEINSGNPEAARAILERVSGPVVPPEDVRRVEHRLNTSLRFMSAISRKTRTRTPQRVMPRVTVRASRSRRHSTDRTSRGSPRKPSDDPHPSSRRLIHAGGRL